MFLFVTQTFWVFIVLYQHVFFDVQSGFIFQVFFGVQSGFI